MAITVCVTVTGDAAGTLEMSLRIFCPKVGLQLSTGEEWMALTPRVPGSPFHILEAAVREVRLDLPSAGDALDAQGLLHSAMPTAPCIWVGKSGDASLILNESTALLTVRVQIDPCKA